MNISDVDWEQYQKVRCQNLVICQVVIGYSRLRVGEVQVKKLKFSGKVFHS